MFHIFYKTSVCLLLPLICVIINFLIARKKTKCDLIEMFCIWFGFWCLGVAPATTAFMQMFNPSYTANLLSITISDYIVIREIGFANLSMGLLGLLSLKIKNLRVSAAIAYGMYMLLCMIIHFTRISTIDIGEVASMLTDLWTFTISLIIIIRSVRKKEINSIS